MGLTRSEDQRLKELEARQDARIDLKKAKFRKKLEPILWRRGWRPVVLGEYIFAPNRRVMRSSYVYAWYIGDEVVYVGMGVEKRAYRSHDASYQVMCLVPGFRVQILVYLHTATEARRVESRLIAKWKPKYNRAP